MLPDKVWIVNPGSVGLPAYDAPSLHYIENGSPYARYAVIGLVAESRDNRFHRPYLRLGVSFQRSRASRSPRLGSRSRNGIRIETQLPSPVNRAQ
jgi:hypothetical protein